MSTFDLTGMSVSRALGMLGTRQCSGELCVVTTYRRATFQLVDGEIVLVQSDRPSDRLGLRMMKAGDIGVIDLHCALIEQHQQRLNAIANDTETSRLGEILVNREVLNADELADALKRYSEAMVASLEQDFVHTIKFDGDDDIEALASEAEAKRRPKLERLNARPQTSSLTRSE